MDELTVAEQEAPTSHDGRAPRLSPQAAADLVLHTVAHHADALLRTARGHSLCADDAHDAYQRALEIFMRRARTLDPATADRWLHVVVKHEAIAVRRERMALVAPEEVDLDRHEASPLSSPEEQALSAERVTRTAEALQRLKPHELRAMWLKALGNSYEEICRETGWSYTKVNRCLAEGRKTFLERYAGIESGAECARWQPILSAIVDREARPDQLADIRPHLRNCRACKATLRELRRSGPRLAAVLPATALAMPFADDAPGPGLLTRLVDMIGAAVHERATTSALKLQAVIDATSAGKVAAVAASAAAVAGGGVAVVHETTPDRATAKPAARRAAGRPAPTVPVARLSAAVATHRVAEPAAPPRAAHWPRRTGPRPAASASAPTPSARKQAAIEFAPEPSAPTPTSSMKQTPRPMNGGEFDP